MSDRLDEAINWWENDIYMKLDEAEENHVRELANAARAYRNLLANGQRVEPDYEAAAKALYERITNRTLNTTDPLAGVWKRDAKAAVDAAIGDKLLIDPTTEEE